LEDKILYLEKINEEKNLILASVSHDLKSPINGNIFIIDEVIDKLDHLQIKDK
jgi:hypothetical protein